MKHFNFSPTVLTAKQQKSITIWYYSSLAAILLTVIILSGLYVRLHRKLQIITIEHAVYQEHNQRIADIKHQTQKLVQGHAELEKYSQLLLRLYTNPRPDYFLTQLALLFPNQVCLSAYSCDDKKSVILKGSAQNESVLSSFIQKLSQQTYIKNVALTEIKREHTALQFTINCRIVANI